MFNIKLVILLVLTSSLLNAAPKKELDILLVGKSGSKKSVLINIFYNHMKGKQFEDPRDIIIPLRSGSRRLQVNVEEYKSIHGRLKEYDSAETNKIRPYRMKNDQFIATFWDSPGLDEKNQTQLVDFLGTTPVHAIAVVIHTQTDEKSIDILRRLLPKSSQKNILAIYSYHPSWSSYEWDEVATQFSSLFTPTGTSIPLPLYDFNSNIIFIGPDEPDSPQRKNLLLALWNENEKTLERLLLETETTTPSNVAEFKQIQELRQKIEDAIGGLNRQFQLVEHQKTNLKILEAKTGDYSEKIQSCKDEIEKLEADRATMKKGLRIFEAELKQLAMKTDDDAYVSYLSPWAVRLERDYSISEAEQARQKQLCQNWVGIYAEMHSKD